MLVLEFGGIHDYIQILSKVADKFFDVFLNSCNTKKYTDELTGISIYNEMDWINWKHWIMDNSVKVTTRK